jgi:hypothetical protein
MGFWKELGRAWKNVATGKYTEQGLSKLPHTTAAEKREAARAMNEQIQAYKEQTAITRTQLDEAKMASDAERRRVEEKQIRGLRNRSRGIGLLNSQSGDQSSNLGTSSGVASKLGT